MKGFIEKLIERLEEELKLADEVKEKCARENPLMFDNTKGYSTGISNAKSFVNELAEEYKPKTNADKIRAMTDEELAEYIFGVSIGNAPCVLCSEECDFCELSDEECKSRTLKWLQSEAE